jgi:hypothetical protein
VRPAGPGVAPVPLPASASSPGASIGSRWSFPFRGGDLSRARARSTSVGHGRRIDTQCAPAASREETRARYGIGRDGSRWDRSLCRESLSAEVSARLLPIQVSRRRSAAARRHGRRSRSRSRMTRCDRCAGGRSPGACRWSPATIQYNLARGGRPGSVCLGQRGARDGAAPSAPMVIRVPARADHLCARSSFWCGAVSSGDAEPGSWGGAPFPSSVQERGDSRADPSAEARPILTENSPSVRQSHARRPRPRSGARLRLARRGAPRRRDRSRDARRGLQVESVPAVPSEVCRRGTPFRYPTQRTMTPSGVYRRLLGYLRALCLAAGFRVAGSSVCKAALPARNQRRGAVPSARSPSTASSRATNLEALGLAAGGESSCSFVTRGLAQLRQTRT